MTSFLIPSHASRPGDDPIFALNSEARARAQAGEAVINATVGALLDDEGRLAVIPTVSEVLREVPPEVSAGYAPIAGPPAFLRAVVADLLGDRPEAAWAVAAATPGGSGALRMAITNFLEPGQSLLTTSFFWGPYRTLADDSERRLATFRTFDERGRLDVADFEAKVQKQLDEQGRVLAILNSPCHNPTGYSFDDDEWRAVVEVIDREAKRGPIALAFDVAYARYGATDLARAVDLVLPLAHKAQLLFMWSASKSFTEYGLRVGALVALHPDAEERRRMDNAFAFACRGTWSNCNAGGMSAITRVLTDPALKARVDRERAQLKALLDHRVAKWNELAGKAGLRYPRYDGGFFTTVFCDDAPGAAARLKAEGVFVVPQAGALRVALCSVAERDVPRLVDAIARAVR
ncbi:Biosynthetic Aromatic amino acid aminotransferase alpha [Minicystis rosea]|nr:Biosynthetic Aromatic amino acid aminotransferase alpha [Minicystis rosea]